MQSVWIVEPYHQLIRMLNFPREIGKRRRVCRSKKHFLEYVNTFEGKTNLYTSLYHFTHFDVERPWRPDYSSAILDKAWWDFDAKHDNEEEVRLDVAELLRRINGPCFLVFTGRGYHVYEPFVRPVIGREWAGHIERYQRMRARGLKTLDGVGFPERLTRVPGTYNVTRGSRAVCVDVGDFLSDPRTFYPPTKDDYSK